MSRKLLLDTLKCIETEVHAHFTRRFRTTLHSDRFHMRLKKLFDYTLSDGKCARGQLALDTFQALCTNASSVQLKNAAKVAASIEMLQSFFLIIDDVVDHSVLRRGKPSWHTLPEIGLKACIDGLLLESAVDYVIRSALCDHPRKYSILDNVTETKEKTVTGQELDTATTKIEEFTWPLYRDIVEHKTSHYTYYFPLSIGFQLADVSTNLSFLRNIAYKLGYLFQAQDDYLDAFGSIAVTGKSSNDFSDSKCTWIVCTLLDRIHNNEKKMEYFRKNFGHRKPECLKALRDLIVNEEIDKAFQNFQEKTINELNENIENFPIPEIRRVLRSSLESIANRKK